MKTKLQKQKLILGIGAVLIIGISILIYTTNPLSNSIKSYLDQHEIAATIINSALIVIGVNLLIFAIGLVSKSTVTNHSIIRKAYRRSRARKRRRIESRQFDVLSHIR